MPPSRPAPLARTPLPAASLPAASLLAAPLLAAAVACSPTLPTPIVSGVDPTWGYNGEETAISIAGAGFYPRVQVDGGGRTDVDQQFEVWLRADPETGLEDAELSDVSLQDHEHLGARVPDGLSAGSYAVQVISPTGQVATLRDAFTVRSTRGDELAVTNSSGQEQWQVGELASLTVELLDPGGERVPEDVLIQVTVPEEQRATTVFDQATLADQLPLPDGSGITGRLGPDGVGVVGVTSTVPVEQLRVSFAVADAASPVEGDSIDLRFEPGEAARLEIELPSTVFDTVAGDAFDVVLQVVDAEGNPVDDASGDFVILESCPGGTWASSTAFTAGRKELELRFTQATGDGCPLSSVLAFGFIDGVAAQAESAGFEVLPADPEGLVIDIDPLWITAGEEVLADVQAVDRYSNPVRELDGGSLTVQVSVDGGAPVAPAAQDCSPLDDGDGWCLVQVNSAGDEVALLVSTVGPSALSGVSEPFTVEAGTAIGLSASLDVDEVIAGEAFTLTLLAVDPLGNGVVLDLEGADPVVISAEEGDLSCAWAGSGSARGVELYDCVATLAAAGRTVQVAVPSRSLTAETEAFTVVNGPLSLVLVDVGGVETVTAGEELAVSLVGTDAWGNAYREQDDPVVALADLSGAVSPGLVTLAADGTAVVDVRLTVARADDRVVASQGGVELGASATFDVLAADASTLSLTVAGTFAWLDEAVPLTVQALDPYGNVDAGYAGALTVTSAGGLGDPVALPAAEAGVARGSFTFDLAGLGDVLLVSDGVLSDTAVLDALDATCTDPPTARLAVAGDDPAVLCIIDGLGRTAAVSADGGDSEAGAEDLAAWHFGDGLGSWVRSTTAVATRSWEEAGRWEVLLVVADEAACAAEDRVVVYVGSDDGAVTGPIELSLDEPELYAGGGDGYPAEATATVQGWTCTGDPATGAAVQLRADLGRLEGVTATGAGLALVLGDDGLAEAAWSVADEVYAGEGTLLAGVPGGQAHGEVTVEVLGDRQPPRLVALEPAGTFDDLVDGLELGFSEELLGSSVQAEALTLADPDGVEVVLEDGDLALSSDRRSVYVDLPAPIDGASGAWLLQLNAAPRGGLRDLEGNILDGAWTGASSAFAVELGGVSNDAPPLLTCTLGTSTFRPDGDDGDGEEADAASYTLAAASVPAWWWLQVIDEQGVVVRTSWLPEGVTSDTTLTWDGRGDDGLVRPNGSYDLTVAAADEHWNLAAGCAETVQLDNRIAPLD